MIEAVKIVDIISNSDFMMRDGLDKNLVAQYKENLENIMKENPIIVFDTPNSLVLVDGFHRLAAARQLNWDKIPCEIRKGSVQDAFGFACLANLRHGKPLKPKERRRAICEYVKLNAELSNVQIANQVGVSEITIRRYRQELESAGEIEPQEKRFSADNTIRGLPTSTSVEVDPFKEWADPRVINDDMFSVLANDNKKYDLIIVDPPYGITKESWDKQTNFYPFNFRDFKSTWFLWQF